MHYNLDTTKKHFRLDRMIAVVDPTYDPADDGHNWPLKHSELRVWWPWTRNLHLP
jgi:hypothetical protein